MDWRWFMTDVHFGLFGNGDSAAGRYIYVLHGVPVGAMSMAHDDLYMNSVVELQSRPYIIHPVSGGS